MGAAVFGLYAIAFSALSIHHVSYAVVGIICMFAFEQWGTIYIPAIAQNGTLVNISLIVLAAIAWFRLPAGSTLEFVKYPTRTLLILFIGYAFVSTTWSPPEVNAAELFVDQVHYLIVALIITPLLFRSSDDFTRVLDAITWLGGTLVILFAYIPEFEGRSLAIEYDFEESLSLPLAIGSFAGVVFLITALRLKGSLINILWAGIVCGSALYLITKTGSRGQLLFSIASLIICLPMRWKAFTVNRFIAIILVVLIAAMAVFIIVNTENTLSARIQRSEDSLGTMARVEMATVLINAWLAEPSAVIFGLGNSASWSPTLLGIYSHVLPIEILAELGLFGFIFFSLAMLTLFLQAFTGTQRKKLNQESLNNFAALFACWVLHLLLSCKQGSLLVSTELFMYAVLAEKCLLLSVMKSKVMRSKRKGKLKRRLKFQPSQSV